MWSIGRVADGIVAFVQENPDDTYDRMHTSDGEQGGKEERSVRTCPNQRKRIRTEETERRQDATDTSRTTGRNEQECQTDTTCEQHRHHATRGVRSHPTKSTGVLHRTCGGDGNRNLVLSHTIERRPKIATCSSGTIDPDRYHTGRSRTHIWCILRLVGSETRRNPAGMGRMQTEPTSDTRQPNIRIKPHESMQRPKARQRQKQKLQYVQGKLLPGKIADTCIGPQKWTEELRTITSI